MRNPCKWTCRIGRIVRGVLQGRGLGVVTGLSPVQTTAPGVMGRTLLLFPGKSEREGASSRTGVDPATRPRLEPPGHHAVDPFLERAGGGCEAVPIDAARLTDACGAGLGRRGLRDRSRSENVGIPRTRAGRNCAGCCVGEPKSGAPPRYVGRKRGTSRTTWSAPRLRVLGDPHEYYVSAPPASTIPPRPRLRIRAETSTHPAEVCADGGAHVDDEQRGVAELGFGEGGRAGR
jgi:hypothetical protein